MGGRGGGVGGAPAPPFDMVATAHTHLRDSSHLEQSFGANCAMEVKLQADVGVFEGMAEREGFSANLPKAEDFYEFSDPSLAGVYPTRVSLAIRKTRPFLNQCGSLRPILRSCFRCCAGLVPPASAAPISHRPSWFRLR